MSKRCGKEYVTYGKCGALEKNYRHLFHLFELEIIEGIQFHYKYLANEIRGLMHFTDPRFVYYIIFPLAFAFSPGIGISLLWVTIIAEAITESFKTLIQAPRPYWWLEQNKLNYKNITLKQYEGTCQATFGFPSTHITTSVAVWFTIYFLTKYNMTKCEKKAFKYLIWIMAALCSISRMFLATNFPHQLLISAILGMLIAKEFRKRMCINIPPVNYFIWAVILSALSEAMPSVMKLFGQKNYPSYCNAKLYCIDYSWVYPMKYEFGVSFVRASGLISGLGVVMLITSTIFSKNVAIKPNFCKRLSSLIITYIMLTVNHCTFHPSRLQTRLYHMLIYIEFFMISMLTVFLVPRFMKLYKR